jgi:hypothetical protein
MENSIEYEGADDEKTRLPEEVNLVSIKVKEIQQ